MSAPENVKIDFRESRYAEDFLQVMLGSGDVKQPDGTVIELHEQIHIAGGISFITNDGVE